MVRAPETEEVAEAQERLMAEEVIETVACARMLVSGPVGSDFEPHGFSIFEIFTSFWLVKMAKANGRNGDEANRAVHQALRAIGFTPRGDDVA